MTKDFNERRKEGDGSVLDLAPALQLKSSICILSLNVKIVINYELNCYETCS